MMKKLNNIHEGEFKGNERGMQEKRICLKDGS